MTTQLKKREILECVNTIQKQSSPEAVTDTQIADNLALALDEVQDYLDLLESEGLVKLAKSFGPSYAAWLTPQGRIYLRTPEFVKSLTTPSVINVLNLIDSQIQNLVQSGSTSVISQSSNSTINDEINELIDRMLQTILSSNIPDESKQDYAIEATGLKNELKKSSFNLARIREMIAFLGDVDGALGLTSRLAPYIVALWDHIEKLIPNIK
jgi:predicted transcriptional regulator